MAAGIPDWLDAWLGAVGFPVQRLGGRESLDGGHWRRLEKPGLLILGRKAAGRGPAEMGRLAIELRNQRLGNRGRLARQIADIRRRHRGGAEEGPGALGDLRMQAVALAADLPPADRSLAAGLEPSAWLDGPRVSAGRGGLQPARRGRIACGSCSNYLPWQEQLGRCEMADELHAADTGRNGQGGERSLDSGRSMVLALSGRREDQGHGASRAGRPHCD